MKTERVIDTQQEIDELIREGISMQVILEMVLTAANFVFNMIHLHMPSHG